jgi:hypothetical protein
LLHKKRNAGAIYIIGYALELGLKRKVSQTLGFINGFPESIADFNSYADQITSFNAISTGVGLTQLREIKKSRFK